MQFILDCSVTMNWCFEDEHDPYSLKVLESLQDANAVVPSLWTYEVCNVLVIAGRRKRINESQITLFLNSLMQLPIKIQTSTQSIERLLTLSHKYGLTAYDCAYLELVLTMQLPIATKDNNLIRALQEVGGTLYLK